jgi:hypothetical protein
VGNDEIETEERYLNTASRYYFRGVPGNFIFCSFKNWIGYADVVRIRNLRNGSAIYGLLRHSIYNRDSQFGCFRTKRDRCISAVCSGWYRNLSFHSTLG